MRYLALTIFFLVCLIHLIDSWKDNKEARAKTKPFLLLFLLLYYFFSADSMSVPLVLALFTSWLGDVLLIPSGNGWFVSGGISFLISHLFFIFAYLSCIDLKTIRWYFLLPAGVIYLAVSLMIMYSVRDNTPKKMMIPMFAYLIINSTMNIFALMLCFSGKGPGAAVAYFGAILFFFSDCSLFLVRYHKNKELVFKKHFTIMITYLLGEFLITQGILIMSR